MKTSEIVRGMANLRSSDGSSAMRHSTGKIYNTDLIADVIVKLEEVAEASEEFKNDIEESFSDAGVDAYNRLADALFALKKEKERYE